MNFIACIRKWLNSSNTPLNELITANKTDINNLSTNIDSKLENQTNDLTDTVIKYGGIMGTKMNIIEDQYLYTTSNTETNYYTVSNAKGGYVRVILEETLQDSTLVIVIDGGEKMYYHFEQKTRYKATEVANTNGSVTNKEYEYNYGYIDIPFNSTLKLSAFDSCYFYVNIIEYLNV